MIIKDGVITSLHPVNEARLVRNDGWEYVGRETRSKDMASPADPASHIGEPEPGIYVKEDDCCPSDPVTFDCCHCGKQYKTQSGRDNHVISKHESC